MPRWPSSQSSSRWWPVAHGPAALHQHQHSAGIGWRPEIAGVLSRLPGLRFTEVVAETLTGGALPAPLVSEHIAFVRAGGTEAGHLLPVPRTPDALDVQGGHLSL